MQELTRTGAINHSNRVFNWMKNQELYRARTDIYNEMICLHARHDRLDYVRRIFKEMKICRLVTLVVKKMFHHECSKSNIFFLNFRCKPDVETYNALMNAHGRAGKWQWASDIFDDMLKDGVETCLLMPLLFV